ncbi:MAG TPA: DNA-formamidopyrimidine glycosylase family protein [Actinomycetota bacterium]|nr:DNA-formamidopyrimidine glycosylase family protein [Actinomycetota bacterium]
MPEGHLIHRYARAHDHRFARRTVRVTSPQGKFAAGAAAVDGGDLSCVEAFGKHILYRWPDAIVRVHLGMQGRFLDVSPDLEPTKWARLRLQNDAHAVELIAPGACELLSPDRAVDFVAKLGPDPLRADADVAAVVRAIKSSGKPIGALLIDQSVVAGLGNVLRAEILSLARISPLRLGCDLDADELDQLWTLAMRVMERARDDGRIITRGDDPTVHEAEGRYVYKRDTCARCGTPVEQRQLAARTMYWCPACQH